MEAFITGSHAYGTPNKDSDIDLVVLVESDDTIYDLLKGDEGGANTDEYETSLGAPLRFGKLNLICCVEERKYEIWRKGTEQLKAIAPVTREQAVELFQKLIRESMVMV